MTRRSLAWIAGLLTACTAAVERDAAFDGLDEPLRATTSGAIAIANLDHQIALRGDERGAEDLLLTRARFLADHDALERALALAEGRCAGPCASAGDYLRRARARAAVHRFADALDDLDAADRSDAGDARDDVAALRASIQVATGCASGAVPALEAAVARHPDLASRAALAGAYAAMGHLRDADALYTAAIDDLDTTSPFPYAWLYLSRGMMWAEQDRDLARGEALYRRALAHLPELATATIHLAVLEDALGQPAAAAAYLAPLARSGEPEALGLAGALHLRTGEPERGRREISAARARFESLLARHPLAFADHAAAFYLGPGADPERACALAQLNLAVRRTRSALDLAITAAHAAGRPPEACGLAVLAVCRAGPGSSGEQFARR